MADTESQHSNEDIGRWSFANVSWSSAGSGQRHLRFQLDLPELQFPIGKSTALLGHEGSGKSTTLEILTGARLPSRGSVTYNGEAWNTELRSKLGYAPEELPRPDHLSCLEFLTLTLCAYGINPRSHRNDLAARSLEHWGLSRWAAAKVSGLPHAPTRRLALAMATAHSPDLLVLDEPFSGIGASHRERLLDHLQTHRERGKTLVIATSIPGEIEGLVDHVHVMRRGKLAWSSLTTSDGAWKALPANGGLELEVSGLNRDVADQWRRNVQLPIWDSFTSEGFLTRLQFVRHDAANQWLNQSVKERLVVTYFGAPRTNGAEAWKSLEHFLNDSASETDEEASR